MILDFKNTNIYYQTYGKGPAVILLHGFLESSTMWESLIPKIAQNNTVISLDLPGFGKSGVIEEIHTMEIMAEVVISILKNLEIDTATFIGHSMGGYVTLAITESYPNKVAKIILLNSSAVADSAERKLTRDRALILLEKHPRAFISMAIGNWATASSREKFGAEIERLKEEAYSFPLNGITAALLGMRDRKDRSKNLASFTGPKYMLLAEDDPIIPLKENLQLANESQVETKVISGGHMSLIENKSAVEEFLEAIL